MAARSLATTRLTETWIHTVDVAVAFGPPPAPTDRLWHTARLTWRTVPYALATEGLTPRRRRVRARCTGWLRLGLRERRRHRRTHRDPRHRTGPVHRGRSAASAADTDLSGDGPDADAVLRLVRTFA